MVYQEGKALAALHPGCFSRLCLQQATLIDAVVSPCRKKAGLFLLLQEHSIPQAQSLFPISQPTVCTGIHEGPFANYDQRYRTAKKQTTTKN